VEYGFSHPTLLARAQLLSSWPGQAGRHSFLDTSVSFEYEVEQVRVDTYGVQHARCLWASTATNHSTSWRTAGVPKDTVRKGSRYENAIAIGFLLIPKSLQSPDEQTSLAKSMKLSGF
jgi:hypothetical protein